MDDLRYGVRDKRGHWRPKAPLEVAPFWTGKFEGLGRWALGYLWPHNTLFMAVTLAYWYLVLPDWATMRTLSWGWPLALFAVNSAGIFVFYGAIELFYYVRRRQGTRFKYNSDFPADKPSDVFWFKSQNFDNFLRTFFMSIPIWTVVEVATLWCFANGCSNAIDSKTHWLWFSVLILLAPAIHEVHFFCMHRLIHQGALYKYVHSVHHNSINPSPWSSMSMHPLESTLFFAEMAWHLLLPSTPFVALFQLTSTAYGAVVGHIGFDRLEVTDGLAVDSHAYAHYLHHKYFEVNYGGDGLVPLDKWFGTWHDGTRAGDERMNERYRKKMERLRARRAIAAQGGA